MLSTARCLNTFSSHAQFFFFFTEVEFNQRHDASGRDKKKDLFFLFSWPSPLIISVGLAKIARGHGRPLGLKLPIAVNQFRAVRGSAAHTLPYSVIEYRLIDSRLLHSSFFSLSRVFTWATWVPQHLLEQWAASATWQIRGSSYLNETKMASNPQKFHLGN